MPTSQHATTNNLRLHCTEAGEGDSVLLVRCFRISSHLYRNISPSSPTPPRAFAIGLPGYGLSDKPLDTKYNFAFFENILEGFCDALGILHTDLVVHDLGGLFWAVRHPRRVNQLVLARGSAKSASRTSVQRLAGGTVATLT